MVSSHGAHCATQKGRRDAIVGVSPALVHRRHWVIVTRIRSFPQVIVWQALTADSFHQFVFIYWQSSDEEPCCFYAPHYYTIRCVFPMCFVIFVRGRWPHNKLLLLFVRSRSLLLSLSPRACVCAVFVWVCVCAYLCVHTNARVCNVHPSRQTGCSSVNVSSWQGNQPLGLGWIECWQRRYRHQATFTDHTLGLSHQVHR